MAEKKFILQGVTEATHTAAVRALFDLHSIEKVLISVAFITETGVQQIEACLSPHAKRMTVFAGIRNDITTHQGLKCLYRLGGVLYAVDTGSRNILFHPKLFLVRGKSHAGLLLGSANLTLGGLNNNVEAGIAIKFDLANAADKAVVDEIDTQLSALPGSYPENVLKVGKISLLDEMLANGRLADEMAAVPPRPSTSATNAGGDSVPRIKLKVPAIHRPLRKAKAPPKKTAPKKATLGVALELVWESKPLTRRDLTIPIAVGTHATGSVNLDKGLLPDDADHRHYFRDEVFPDLGWAPAKSAGKVEQARARFQLVIKGIDYGEYDLTVRHTTSTTSASYLQHNAMTRLSWGNVTPFVQKPNLIGRTLALYRDKADLRRFVLEID